MDIDYVYGAVYYGASDKLEQSFAQLGASNDDGSVKVIGDRRNKNIKLQRSTTKKLEHFNASELGLGAWTLNVHHFYDPDNHIIYKGDGNKISAKSIGENVIKKVAGYGYHGLEDGEIGDPATTVYLKSPKGICYGPNGDLFIADSGYSIIFRVDTNGIIHKFAGQVDSEGFSGDGGPAVDAQFSEPRDVAVGSDGCVYISDYGNQRIRKVDNNGIITTVAGNGERGFNGENGPATTISLYDPESIAMGPDNSLYIADKYNYRIRRVRPGGMISTVAGNGTLSNSPDGISALEASVRPTGLAIGPDGSIYYSDIAVDKVKKINPSGIITTVAGTGLHGFSGDGGLAVSARLDNPTGLTIGRDGSLYIADSNNNRVRRVSPLGNILTIAGYGVQGYDIGKDGFLATRVMIRPSCLCMSPDGDLNISESSYHRVRSISSPLPDFTVGELIIPDEFGDSLYVFNNTGRHLKTMDTLTGQTLLTFGYDDNNLLVSITDLDGDVTTIERDGNGRPQAIVGPDGHRTGLGLDANGYLTTIGNPAGETYKFSYTDEGLITRTINPRGNEYHYTYDDMGRLLSDTNPAGGGWSVTRTENENRTHGIHDQWGGPGYHL